MGYFCHHAIVVTASNQANAALAHAKATEIFASVSPIAESYINEFFSFFIPPDGSKEGWDTSNEGDARRDQFIEWLDTQRDDDGYSYYTWAEIQYGDEQDDNRILRTDATSRPEFEDDEPQS